MQTQNISLSQQDCQNVKIALNVLAKQTGVGELEMMAALQLSQKFNWVEKEKTEIKNEEIKTV